VCDGAAESHGKLSGVLPALWAVCYLRIQNAEGYVLIAVYLYACVRVIRISQKVLNLIA